MKTYLVSETYEIITEESAENGDFEETGFTFQDEPMTAREIAEYLYTGGFTEASASQYHDGVWFSANGDMDMHSGDYENRSLHFTGGMDRRLVRAICKSAHIRLTF